MTTPARAASVVPERTLPIRVPILDGESLESWLEALARRNGLTVRQLLPALGLPAPRTPYGLVQGIDTNLLRRVERQARLPTGRLDEAVLDRFAPLGVVPARRPGAPEHRWRRWASGSGARYCPRCLAARQGRWQLHWYLNWSFACLRHRIVLAGRCPRCARPPRSGEARWDHLPTPGRCGHADPDFHGRGPRRPRCDADLTVLPASPLDGHHPLLHAQRWLDQLLGIGSPRTVPTEAELVPIAGMQVPRVSALDAVATLMRHALARQLVSAPRPADGVRLPDPQPKPNSADHAAVSSVLAQTDQPAIFGVAAVIAVEVLIAPTQQAAVEAMRWMLPRPDDDPHAAPERRDSRVVDYSTRDPVIDAIMLRGRAPMMRISDRLAHRTAHPIPRHPLNDHETATERGWPHVPGRLSSLPARLVPQVAWASVTEALPGHATKHTIAFGAALAMAIVRTGTFAPWARIALELGLPRRLATSIGAVWRRLAETGTAAVVLAGIDTLVETLLDRPPPIDYARRRWVFQALPLVATARFRRAVHDAGLVATGRRRRYATMRLWELLTGGDIRLHPGDLAPRDPADRTSFAAFCAAETPAISDYLAEEAERHLLRHRINEPVTWQPELDDPAGPTWRSPAPDLARRLAGWTTPSRRHTLRRSARDHTPRWESIIATLGGSASMDRLAAALHDFQPATTLAAGPWGWPGNDRNDSAIGTWGWESDDVRFVHSIERDHDINLLAPVPDEPHHYTLTPDAQGLLASYVWSIADPRGGNPWPKVAHVRCSDTTYTDTTSRSDASTDNALITDASVG